MTAAQMVKIFYNWVPLFTVKIATSHGDVDPSNSWFLGPTRGFNPNSVWIGSAVFAGLTTVTDRQTTLIGL